MKHPPWKASLKKRNLLACAAALALMFGQLTGIAQSARAQGTQDPKENLRILYMLMISQDICDFDATDEQSGNLEKMTDSLQETLKMSDGDAEKFYAEIEEVMKKQKADAGLCEAAGEWSKSYEAGMEALGK